MQIQTSVRVPEKQQQGTDRDVLLPSSHGAATALLCRTAVTSVSSSAYLQAAARPAVLPVSARTRRRSPFGWGWGWGGFRERSERSHACNGERVLLEQCHPRGWFGEVLSTPRHRLISCLLSHNGQAGLGDVLGWGAGTHPPPAAGQGCRGGAETDALETGARDCEAAAEEDP